MIVLLAGILAAAMTGCSTSNPSETGFSSSASSSEPAESPESSASVSSESSSSSSASSVTPILSLSEYPTVDGSTATLPLMAKVLSETTGTDASLAESYVSASKTAQSWLNLSDGNADLLLAYEAPESIKEQLQGGPELEVTAIGRDALVFIVNESNPVTSLTQDQIRDIYTGTIIDWSEVGGENIDIVPFQRDETSGSQTLFQKLLIGDRDLTLLDPPSELRPGMMGALVDRLAEYNNEKNAIGYSVYYYISEMYQKPGLKLIGVDGVQPGYDTIKDNEYPL